MRPSHFERLVVLSLALVVTGTAAGQITENTGLWAGTIKFEAEDFTGRQAGLFGAGLEAVTWDIITEERGFFPGPFAHVNPSGGLYIQARRDAGYQSLDPESSFVRGTVVSYELEVLTGGDYQIFVRFSGHNAGSDSFWLRIRENGGWHLYSAPTEDWRNQEFSNGWRSLSISSPQDPADPNAVLAPTIETLTPGTYTLDIAMREDGCAIDAIYLDRTGTFTVPMDADIREIPFWNESPGVFDENTGDWAGTFRIEAENFFERTVGTGFPSADERNWLRVPGEIRPFPSTPGDPNDPNVPPPTAVPWGNASQGVYLQARIDAGGVNTDPDTAFDTGPVVSYQLNVATAGTYRIWVRFTSYNTGSDSFWLRIREDSDFVYRYAVPTNAWRASRDFTNHWRSFSAFFGSGPEAPTEVFLSPGTYHLDIALREDGVGIDAIVLDRTGFMAPSDRLAFQIPESNAEPVTIAENEQEWAGTLKFEAEFFDERTTGLNNDTVITWSKVPQEAIPFPDDPNDPNDTYDVASANRDAYMQGRLDVGYLNDDPDAVFDDGPTMTYRVDIKTGGDYRIFVRFAAHDLGSDSFWLRLRELDSIWLFEAPTNDWRFGRTFTNHWRSLASFFGSGPEFDVVETLSPGIYHIDIGMREDGLALDTILLDRTGTAAGPGDSNKNAVPYSTRPPSYAASVPTFVDVDDCLQGPDVPYPSGCASADCDFDGDSDMLDFGILQKLASGL